MESCAKRQKHGSRKAKEIEGSTRLQTQCQMVKMAFLVQSKKCPNELIKIEQIFQNQCCLPKRN